MPDPNRLRFNGKGAAAGMMLMSTMGPAGAAIGVAIDEGIAKDIDDLVASENYSMEQALRQKLNASITRNCSCESVFIRIERYGFRTWGKAEFADPVSPEIKLHIKTNGLTDIVIDYPASFGEDVPILPLAEAKSDGAKVIAVLEHAMEMVTNKIEQALANQSQ